MNQKISKRLRKIAKELPDLPTYQYVYERRYGRELDPKITKDEKGKPIDPKNVYTIRTKQEVKVCHYDKLKQQYLKGGQDAVIKYSGIVTRLHQRLLRRKMQVERDPDELAKQNVNTKTI